MRHSDCEIFANESESESEAGNATHLESAIRNSQSEIVPISIPAVTLA